MIRVQWSLLIRMGVPTATPLQAGDKRKKHCERIIKKNKKGGSPV
jgi:hypothetical protein